MQGKTTVNWSESSGGNQNDYEAGAPCVRRGCRNRASSAWTREGFRGPNAVLTLL